LLSLSKVLENPEEVSRNYDSGGEVLSLLELTVHRLVDIGCTSKMTMGRPAMISSFIAGLLTEAASDISTPTLYQKLENLRVMRPKGIWGIDFEDLVHGILVKTGELLTFVMRTCAHPEVKGGIEERYLITIPEFNELKEFEEKDFLGGQVLPQAGVYWKPDKVNFGNIDSFGLADVTMKVIDWDKFERGEIDADSVKGVTANRIMFCQITTGPDHGMSSPAIADFMTRKWGKVNPKPMFIFVVCCQHFDKFKWHFSGDLSKPEFAAIGQAFLDHFEFYVMRVPVSLKERRAEGALLKCWTNLKTEYTVDRNEEVGVNRV
jgi:hypothetical protein